MMFFVDPGMVFTNVINPRSSVNRKDEYKQTLVKKGASIGANATIICGVTLGEYSFVGAGSVVTKSVKPHEMVAGVPAKRIGWLDERGNRIVNHHFKNKMEFIDLKIQQDLIKEDLNSRIETVLSPWAIHYGSRNRRA